MADQDDQLGQIRVSLSLLSGADTQAAKDLANSLKEIAQMFRELKSTDFMSSAKEMGRLHQQMVSSTQTLRTNQVTQAGRQFHQENTSGLIIPADDARQRLADSQKQAQQQVQQQQQQQQQSRNQLDARAQAERQRSHDEMLMTTEQKEAARTRERYNLPSLNQAQPSSPNSPWYDRVDTLSGGTQDDNAFSIPRFGQMTVQDYLQQLRNRSMRTALGQTSDINQQLSQFPTGPLTEDQQGQYDALVSQRDNLPSGNMAANFQKASDWAGNAYAAVSAGRRLNNFTSRYGLDIHQFDPRNLEQGGTALGYQRGSNIGPFQLPFGAASGEGARQISDRFGLAFRAGINMQQAGAIVDSTTGAGFSGNQASDIENGFMAPLVQRYGANPQDLVPFTQAIRTGATNVTSLTTALSGLGEAARSADMTLSDTAQAFTQVVEATQAQGGTTVGGINRANLFQSTTGLPGDLFPQIAQNGYVQAMLAAQTGIPGAYQGSLPGSTVLNASYQTAMQLSRAYQGVFPSNTQSIKDPTTGRVIGSTTTTSNEVRDAAVAQAMGFSNVEQYQKFLKTSKSGDLASGLNSAVDIYGQQINQARSSHTAQQQALTEVNKKYGGNWRLDGHGNVVGGDSSLADDANHLFDSTRSTYARTLLEHANPTDKKVNWNELRGMYVRAFGGGDPGSDQYKDAQKEFHQISTEKDPVERQRRLREAIGNHMADANNGTGPSLQVSLTGPAAKLFQATIKNAGGDPNQYSVPTSTGATAAGPNPLPNNNSNYWTTLASGGG